MKLKFRKKTMARQVSRMTKKIRIRKTVKGTAERPRLCVYRSGKHMYAQVINDVTGQTLASASSLKLGDKVSGKALAKEVGKLIGSVAQEKSIKNVVFDRNGFIYHGRVQALAEGAREAGLDF